MKKLGNNSKTKKQLLDAAEKLMLKKGFGATSVDEICKKAKLTKGSFFHYFKSKDDLGVTVLNRFSYKNCETIHERSCRCAPHQDPLRRIYAHIDFAISLSKQKVVPEGCLLGVFSQELSLTHPGMRSVCEQGFQEWRRSLRKDFKLAKERYRSRRTVNVDYLVSYLIAVIEGSQILGKVMRDNRIVGRNLRYFKKYLQYIFGR